MMVFDRVPGVVWLIVGVSVIWVPVALLESQGLVATAWGWWMMFGYPMVGLYAYLEPRWPERFPQRLRRFCLSVLGIQVAVQIAQYMAGQPQGDDLAGMFGENGTQELGIFIFFVLCLALGQWLVHGKWSTLAAVLTLGAVSSVLGEIKLFPVGVVALATLSGILYSLRRRKRAGLLPHMLLLGLVLLIFTLAYNTTIQSPVSLEQFLELQTLKSYTHHSTRQLTGGRYRTFVGRNYGLTIGWNAIRRDTVTFLFGMGLGARGESLTLRTAGVGLLRGNIGLYSGMSLLVMLQELGLVGMGALGSFFFWTVNALRSDIRRHSGSGAVELRYALLLFSLLWPLWLWYSSTWVLHVPMLLYWSTLGYVLGKPHRDELLFSVRVGAAIPSGRH
jgi:hypothetical protein